MKNSDQKVTLVEVGPRDGLQNEKTIIPLNVKLTLIQKLIEAGHKVIEVGGFVSPKWVPQLQESDQIVKSLKTQFENNAGYRFPVLIPNIQGLNNALQAGAQEIALFGAASETFSQKNINASIDESLLRFKDIIPVAQKNNCRIRGYISCVMGCPYEGKVPLTKVIDVAQKIYELGCDEISLGDTIGIGHAAQTRALLKEIKKIIPPSKIAVHFHDTYGQALANILVALEEDIRIIDSSVAGLGGCPYAPGASGNVATEDVIYMLNGMSFETGINLEKLIETACYISDFLKKPPASKVTLAFLAKKQSQKQQDTCNTLKDSSSLR